MTKILPGLCALLLALSQPAWAQLENSNWYFGSQAALHFPASGPPAPLTGSAMTTYEACASVSDAAGRLQFYTNGETVWNRNNQVMSNGTNVGGWASAAQGAAIVQNPANAQQYYLFVADGTQSGGGLKYNLVDMTQQAGLGQVTARAVQLSQMGALTEKLTTVPHANGHDTWVLVHGWQNNTFYAYLVTAGGVQQVPVASSIGLVHSGGGALYGNSVGYMRASPDGSRLAVAIRDVGFEVFDFNATTGQVSNYIHLNGPDRCYGVAFSPDSRLLYGTGLDEFTLWQYNLQAGSAAAVSSSGQVVGFTSANIGSIQASPDGSQLYVAMLGSPYLGIVQHPGVYGSGCTFLAQGVALGGAASQLGLPNYHSAKLNPVAVTASFAATTACAGSATAFTGTYAPATAGTTASWNFGDPASASNTATGLVTAHAFTQAGTYQVAYTVTPPAPGLAVTVTQAVAVLPPPQVRLPADTTSCAAAVSLQPRGSFPAGSTFRWQDGSTGATYVARASGTYSVQVTTPAGCTATAVTRLVIAPAPQVRLPADTLVCGAAAVLLRAQGSFPAGSTFRWQDGSTAATYTAQSSGTYSVQVTTPAGCTAGASSRVVLGVVPVVRLGADTVACGSQVVLRAQGSFPAGSSYRWQDGSTAATYAATASGTYAVQVTTPAGCMASASRQVTLAPLPAPRLPADTLACSNAVLLHVQGNLPAGSTFRWQDGSTAATYTAQSSGLYSVQVTTPAGCTAGASSRVTLGQLPVVTLGADTLVCPNSTFVLRPNAQPAGTLYRWQDGSTAPYYVAHGPGTYAVQVRAGLAGCPASATRVAAAQECPVIVPNVITPNGDAYNEYFVLKGLTPTDWHLTIFDRWGRQVYDRAQYDNGWNAADLSAGVYYYRLKHNTTSEQLKGWVEVMRPN